MSDVYTITVPKADDPEVQALLVIVVAMKGLNTISNQRIVNYMQSRYGVQIPFLEAAYPPNYYPPK